MSNTDIKKKDIQTRSINDVGKHCMLQGSGCYWLLVGSFTSFAEDSYRASQKKSAFMKVQVLNHDNHFGLLWKIMDWSGPFLDH